MNYFLIDYENVHDKEIKELENIKDGDTLIIFYSNQCRKISLDVLDFSKGITYQIFKAFVGTKNALDFQLSSYLGYLIGKNSLQDAKKDTNYYIVSNDQGYDRLCDYWQKNFSVNVSRISTPEEAPATATKKKTSKKLASKPKKKASKAKASDKATLEEIKEALKDLPKKVLSGDDDKFEEILYIFNENPSKNDIYKELDKKFPDSKHHKKASSIWKKLKPLAKKKNKPGKA